MTDSPDIAELCFEWQDRLGLSHWRVGIKTTRMKDMSVPDRVGEVLINQGRLEAAIDLLDPVDYPETTFSLDVEETIVHELVHIPWEWFRPDAESEPEKHELFEQAINLTARALVKIKREKETQ